MKKRAFIYIIIAGLLWGTSGIFVKYLTPYGLGPLQILSLRGLTASVVMCIYALIANRGLFRLSRVELAFLLGSGVALFATAGSYFTSMQMTSISTAVVLMYMAPMLVMIYSVLFLGERLTRLKTVSVVCMLIGCALVSGVIGGLKFDPLGIAIGALSGVSYAAYNVLTKIQMRRGISPLTAILYNFIFMTVISIAVSRPVETLGCIAAEPLEVIPISIALGVVTFVIPYFLYTVALRELPAGTTSALAIIEPMSATLFGALFFGEHPDIFSGIGIVLILLAVFLLSRAENGKKAENHK